jgi:hypothetical protein
MKSVNTEVSRRKYLRVSELGSRYNLSFSSQLAFGTRIIALDGIRKCLLVLETNKELSEPYILDLNKVSAVTVRKTYGSINRGELKTKGIEEFLKRIDLQFQFKNDSQTFVLPFYDREKENKTDRMNLARNAKNWQMILSKLVELKTEEAKDKHN